MQTPPPTRDATSRRSLQQSAGYGVATPATVVHRTPQQMPAQEALFDQTPFGFGNLQYTPDMMQFPSHAPMSAPPMPQSRLFWDPANDGMQMDLDTPLGVDPFGSTPNRVEQNPNWQVFNPPSTNTMQTPAFQSFSTMSPVPMTSFTNAHMDQRQGPRPVSFVATSTGVDPNMLFSFSNPDMIASFGAMQQQPIIDMSRQPYETQVRDAQVERQMAMAKSQHSRSNKNSSSGSAENAKPALQRSNTDSGMRKNKPLSMESRIIIPAVSSTIPRRSSPLKRQSGGSLKSIPEVRRPRTRLIIDETGRARTETVPAEEDEEETPKPATRQVSQQDLRRQYPGLYEEDDSESEEDEPGLAISCNTSFAVSQFERRGSKHARTDSGGLERSNSSKMARPSSGQAQGAFDKASFETTRPVRRTAAETAHRRFSMMDFPTLVDSLREGEDQHMPDSPGDAAGALKKMVAGRQQRLGTMTASSLSTLY
jgi:hypothetical protein